MTTDSPPGILRASDVARIFTEERRKGKPDAEDMRPETVLFYLRSSQKTLIGGKPRRYAGNPMPAPRGRMSRIPWWHVDQEEDLRAWFNSRAGQGHGRGGRYAGSKTAVS